MRTRISAAAVLLVAAAGLMSAGGSARAVSADDSSTPTSACASAPGATRFGSAAGFVRPTATAAAPAECPPSHSGYPNSGAPPLLYHGGPVMGTPAVGNKVVLTPIFWSPTGHSIPGAYRSVINSYFGDAAADSNKATNVYSTLFQYTGTNGAVNYAFTRHAPVLDTQPLPASGCTNWDKGSIYADGTGYNACVDDDQVIAETERVVTSLGLPRDLGHIYVMFLPKHLESCFNPGSAASSANACTINHTASAAYCAYHSEANSGMVYANMPFPIYESNTGFSCTSESLGGGIQAPNGNVDADVEISPTSHEISEAMTDPDTSGGWYDSSGNENGDDCAYVYGALAGAAGAHYNQTINGNHYLTQLEFSNKEFAANSKGCLASEARIPVVSTISPTSGPKAGGTTVTLNGFGFTQVTSVKFGTVPATTFTILSDTQITAKAPASATAVAVFVHATTVAGSSANKGANRFTYH